MAPRKTENNAHAKFGGANKEHYGMLWYFLESTIPVLRHCGSSRHNALNHNFRENGLDSKNTANRSNRKSG